MDTKTKLFIDFDGTVFDTERFRDGLFQILRKTGFSDDQIESTYKAECMDYKYSVEKHLERLIAIRNFNLELTLAKIGDLYNSIVSKMIYPDVVSFLENIDRSKYEVNLFSLGDLKFQKEKFKYSELSDFFENKYFTEIQKWDYLPELVKANERFVLIDDRSDTVDMVAKKFKNSLAIEIRRESRPIDPMDSNVSYSGVKVKNLTQALKHL